MCRKGVAAAPVYYLFHGDFPDVELFASHNYVHVTEEGPEESFFGPPKALACQRVAMQLIYGAEAENRIGWSDEECNMPVLP